MLRLSRFTAVKGTFNASARPNAEFVSKTSNSVIRWSSMEFRHLPVMYHDRPQSMLVFEQSKAPELAVITRSGGIFDGNGDARLDPWRMTDDTEVREYLLGVFVARDSSISRNESRPIDRDSFHFVERSSHFWRGFLEEAGLWSVNRAPRVELRGISTDVLLRLLDFISDSVGTDWDPHCSVLASVLERRNRVLIEGERLSRLVETLYFNPSCTIECPRLKPKITAIANWSGYVYRNRK